MLHVVTYDEDTSCAACGRTLVEGDDAVVVVDPDTDQFVVACSPETGRSCAEVATTSRVMPCGLLGVVTL